jgi:hypothetical protein
MEGFEDKHMEMTMLLIAIIKTAQKFVSFYNLPEVDGTLLVL